MHDRHAQAHSAIEPSSLWPLSYVSIIKSALTSPDLHLAWQTHFLFQSTHCNAQRVQCMCFQYSGVKNQDLEHPNASNV